MLQTVAEEGQPPQLPELYGPHGFQILLVANQILWNINLEPVRKPPRGSMRTMDPDVNMPVWPWKSWVPLPTTLQSDLADRKGSLITSEVSWRQCKSSPQDKNATGAVEGAGCPGNCFGQRSGIL